jgi:hypothetical protein
LADSAATRFPVLALRAVVSVALMAATALVARAPIGEPAPDAELRVALSTAHGRIEICRTPSEEELSALPVHMRAPRICAETAPDYRMRIAIDGEPRLDQRIVPQGVRRTRPLAVDASLRLAPGPHRIRIDFGPAPLELALDEETAEAFAHLPAASFDEELGFAAGRILLVSLGEDGRLRPVLPPPAS